MEQNRIKREYRYGLFKRIEGNRPLDENHIKKLMNSISEHGWYTNPILVNERFEIIDGQHRFECMKRMNLPVEYVMMNGLTVNSCADLNDCVKRWKMDDYINLYAAQGNDSYVALQQLSEKYRGVVGAICIARLMKGFGASNGSDQNAVKTGRYKAKMSMMEADRILGFVQSCIAETDKVRGRRESVIAALVFAYSMEGVNRDRLRTVYVQNCGKFGEINTIRYALEQIEKAYNRNLVLENRVKIVDAYDSYCIMKTRG